MARVRYVYFDDNKKLMVAPDSKDVGTGRFYFYEADSVSYAVQNFTPGMLEKITPRSFLSAAEEKIVGEPAYDGATG